MACSPIGLISLMDRTLRPVIAKVRILFPVNPDFFSGSFVHSTAKIMFTVIGSSSIPSNSMS